MAADQKKLYEKVWEIEIKTQEYSFKSKVWKHRGKGGWHFLTLPKSTSREIRRNHRLDEEGWGRLRVLARIDQFEWATAIWYDSKTNAYLLPVKASLRKSKKISVGLFLTVTLRCG